MFQAPLGNRWKTLSIADAARALVRDQIVVEAFRRKYRDDAERHLRELRDGTPLDAAAHDLLVDLLGNEARLYVRFLGKGPDDDRYPIDIKGLEGVYFISAPEFDSVGLFDSLDEAQSYLLFSWNDNLAPGTGRHYREPFATTPK